jgi:hypothetical protein
MLAITSEYLFTGEAGLKGDVTLAFAHFNNSKFDSNPNLN